MTVGTEESQRRISALVRVGRAMVSAADYEQALGTLIETVSRLLDVETGGFLVYDPARDELVLQQPAFGIDDPKLIAEYHVPLSAGGNAVRVFLSQRAYLSNDAEHDPRMIHRFVEMFRARSILSIPLIVEDRPIGVFHAINKRSGDFDQADLDLLMLVAPLMAASVQSAQMFRELREKSRQLERAVFLQAELSRTALDAPGMEPLAERLADLIARPVMVLDSGLRPLASARWPGDVVPTQGWLRRPRFPDAGPAPAGAEDLPVVTPIAVGTHFGGYLAVLPAGASLDVLDTRAIEHAAGIFALEMLREQSAYEVESRLKGDVLQDLFTGSYRDEDEAAGLLRRLGYTLPGAYRVARVEVATGGGGGGGGGAGGGADARPARWQEEMQGPQSRLYAALNAVCTEVIGMAALAPWRSGFLLLLPALNPEDDFAIAGELFTRFRKAAEQVRPGLRLSLCLGSAVAAVGALGQSLEEAERALAVARTLEIADRPLAFEHLGVYRVLLGPNNARDRRDFVDEALGPVVRYDLEHGTDLVATLRAWVAADYNVGEAAQRMFVHANTLKYRLKRIRALVGGDPSRGDLRLQVELALKMLDLPRLTASAQ
ncbi:MAG TPA: helix-turn-helix domain-containing protein [Acidimicrobiia bacterium]|nr:helix-turn-helix domain-containing protein [Acidimicrobiia bacterium]